MLDKPDQTFTGDIVELMADNLDDMTAQQLFDRMSIAQPEELPHIQRLVDTKFIQALESTANGLFETDRLVAGEFGEELETLYALISPQMKEAFGDPTQLQTVVTGEYASPTQGSSRVRKTTRDDVIKTKKEFNDFLMDARKMVFER